MKSFKPLYAVFAVYLPLSVFVGFLLLSSYLLESFTDPLPLSLWFIHGFISAICASVYYTLIKKTKSAHSIADMRGAIVLIIFSYSLSSLFHFDIHIGMRLLPSLYNIPSALSVLLIWFPVLEIKRIFSEQELFESYMQNYNGERLRHIMLEDSSLLSETSIGIKKIISRYIIFSLLLFLLLVICRLSGIYINVLTWLLFVSIFIIGIFIIAFLFFLSREYVYAAQGLKLYNRPKVIMSGFIIILAALLAAFILSSDKSFLPPSLLAALLQFIIGLLGRLFRPVDRSNAMIFEPPAFESPVFTNDFQEIAEERDPFPFWNLLKYAALAAAAFLFIWFMISPLLRRAGLFRGIKAWPKGIISFIRVWLSSFFVSITYFIKSLFEGKAGRRLHNESNEVIRRLEENLYAAYSRVKQKDIKKSIGLFARLIFWGEETYNITWKPSFAPIEYCFLLAEAVKNNNHINNNINNDKENDKKILLAGELFEKALYSFKMLSKAEMNEFSALIEMIISIRREM